MPFAVFSIEIKELDNLSVNGEDEVVFLFSANKGIKAEKLSSIISGGELSRLMLAIKYISAKSLEEKETQNKKISFFTTQGKSNSSKA